MVVAGNDAQTGPTAKEHAPDGVTVHVAVQPEPRGSGDAVLCAGPPLAGRKVVVLAVDALLRGDLRSQVDAFVASDVAAWLTLHPTDRPREMGIAILEGDRVVDLEEKPQEPRSDLALCGVWMLTPAVIERLRDRPFINAKGEVDLSATIAEMLKDGATIGGRRFDGRWLDVGAIGSLLATQGELLAEERWHEGRKVVAEQTEIKDPVLIGRAAVIAGSVLGPNVVIGDGAIVRNSNLRDALVVAGARLDDFRGDHVIVAANGEIGRA